MRGLKARMIMGASFGLAYVLVNARWLAPTVAGVLRAVALVACAHFVVLSRSWPGSCPAGCCSGPPTYR